MVVVLVVIALATAAGVGAERRWAQRAHAFSGRILDALLFLVLPPVTFVVVTRLELTSGVGFGLVLGYAGALSAGAAGFVIGRWALRLPPRSTGALVCVAMLGNTGYLGLPLTLTLLGGDQLSAAIAYDAVVTSPMQYIAGFAVGAALGDRAGTTARQRVRAYLLRNPVLLAFTLALIAPEALAPDSAVAMAKAVAVGLLPIGFFVLGVNLVHERHDSALSLPPPVTVPLAAGLGLRLLVAPGVVLAGSSVFAGVPSAYVVQAAMPTAVSALVIAHVFGLDLRLTAGAIAWSTTVFVLAATAAAVVS